MKVEILCFGKVKRGKGRSVPACRDRAGVADGHDAVARFEQMQSILSDLPACFFVFNLDLNRFVDEVCFASLTDFAPSALLTAD